MRRSLAYPRLAALAVLLALILPAQVRAQESDPPGQGKVNIVLTPGRGGTGIAIRRVVPLVKGACAAKEEWCDREVTWLLRGARLPAGWTVRVEGKPGQRNCLSESRFDLDVNNVSKSSGERTEACQRGDTWLYNVFLFDAAGQKKQTIDPLIVWNY